MFLASAGPSSMRLILRLFVELAIFLSAIANSADSAPIVDPWKLPFRGFRDITEGKGPASIDSGGLGIYPITVPHGGRHDIQTLVLTDCAKYQDWQTIVAAFAWRESGQPGNVTRVVNCSPDQSESYGKIMMEVMPTFWARQYGYNPKIKDAYAPYNKPGAVVDFLEKAPAEERYAVVLDSDMLLHKPFLPEEYKLTRGWAIGAAGYTYLKGVANDLAMRHVSSIPPRNDTLSGPPGRRADQVGGPYFMLMDDLRRVAPLWLSTTQEMRQDLDAWKDSGDTAPPGRPVWISEMYGYAFGAARAGVWHHSATDFMFYPSYMPADIPHVIHYGLQFQLDGWEFDKHHYIGFDPLKCPPWAAWQGYDAPKLRGLAGDALSAARLGPPPKPTVSHPKEGIFPPPPHPARVVNDTKRSYIARYRDLLSIFTVAQINAAICEFHSATCPWSAQLEAVCGDSWELYLDVRDGVDEVEFTWGCVDHAHECEGWAKSGECEHHAAYMANHCAVSCQKCVPREEKFAPRERRVLKFSAKSQPLIKPQTDGAKANTTKATTNTANVTQHILSVQPDAKATRRGSSSVTALDLPEYPSAQSPEFTSTVLRCLTAFQPPLEDADLGLCVRAANMTMDFMQSASGRPNRRSDDVFSVNNTSGHRFPNWMLLEPTAGITMLVIGFVGWQALSRRSRSWPWGGVCARQLKRINRSAKRITPDSYGLPHDQNSVRV